MKLLEKLFDLIVSFLTKFISFVGKIIYKQKYKQRLIESLHELDFCEKSILREFDITGKNVLPFPFDNGSVVGLVNKGILLRQSNQIVPNRFNGKLYGCALYSIAKIANDYLTEEMLDYTEGSEQWVLSNRPEWYSNNNYY